MRVKKVVYLILVMVFIVGCSNENINEQTEDDIFIDQRAQQIIGYVEMDGSYNWYLTYQSENKAIIENEYCQISLFFKDEKISKIISISSNEQQTCIFKSIGLDQDLFGHNAEIFEEFVELINSQTSFEFNGFSVSINNLDMIIERME